MTGNRVDEPLPMREVFWRSAGRLSPAVRAPGGEVLVPAFDHVFGVGDDDDVLAFGEFVQSEGGGQDLGLLVGRVREGQASLGVREVAVAGDVADPGGSACRSAPVRVDGEGHANESVSVISMRRTSPSAHSAAARSSSSGCFGSWHGWRHLSGSTPRSASSTP